MQHELRLSGILAKRCGASILIDVASPREMFRALCVNFPAARAEIRPQDWVVFVDGKNIGEEHLDITLPERSVTIELHPVIRGGGGGNTMPIIQMALGAVMIIAGIVISFMSFGMAAPLGAALIVGGVGMMASGLVGILMPIPGPTDLAKMERPEERPSYVFSGPVNVSSQGAVIPLTYGKMRTGSVVISAGIQNESNPT